MLIEKWVAEIESSSEPAPLSHRNLFSSLRSSLELSHRPPSQGPFPAFILESAVLLVF
jgi:hypothetical protein